MPPRKLIDITPPKSKTKAREEKTAAKQVSKTTRKSVSFRNRRIVLALGATAAILALLFFVHVRLAGAKVAIYPVSRDMVLTESFLVKSGLETLDIATKTIPGTVVEQERSGTKLFSSSGVDNRETKAQGTIRVFNNQTKTQILIATTRFISEDGKLFRSNARITIPAGGFLDVGVIAAEAGSEYNIGPSNFSLPGLLGSAAYTAVYGKSFAAMAGGGNTSTSVVTESDLSKAEETLLQELMQQAKEELSQSMSAPFVILEKSMKEQVVSVSQSVEEGAPVSEFSATGKVRVQALSYSLVDVETLAKEVLALAISKGEKIQDGTVHVITQDALFSNASQSGTLKLEIRAKVYQNIEREELAESLLGRSKTEADQILLDYPQIEKYDLSFFPFWKQTMPRAKESLNIELIF